MRFLTTTIVAVVGAAAAAAAGPPPAAEDVVPRLVAALKDPDFEVRQNLALALARVGAEAVGPLTGALQDDIPARRAGAAYALGLLGNPARPAVPALLDALSDRDADVRRQASYALSRLVSPGPATPRAAPGVTPPRPSTAARPGGRL